MDFYLTKSGGYVRLTKRGAVISWTNQRPLFSERNGYKVPFMRFRGWRFFFVR